METLGESSLNHSNLFNAMIHPFTRMVIYGVIWYQGKRSSFFVCVLFEHRMYVRRGSQFWRSYK